MRIEIDWQVAGEGLDDDGVRAAVGAAVSVAARPVEILSVALVNDPTLAELHERYLDDPSVTDVMSFDLTPDGPGGASSGSTEAGEAPLVGEVIVSLDRARDVSRRRGVGLDYELSLYLIHGTLHLLGFDDLEVDDRLRMREAEQRALLLLGFSIESAPHEEP